MELEARKITVPERTPLQWLEIGLKSRTHEKRGWLKDKLLHHGLLEATPEALWKRIISDYNCQLSAIEGMKLSLGPKFTDQEHKGTPGEKDKFVTNERQPTRHSQKHVVDSLPVARVRCQAFQFSDKRRRRQQWQEQSI